MTLNLPSDADLVRCALELAYPGAHLDAVARTFTAPNGTTIACAGARDIATGTRLDGATLGDQFTYRRWSGRPEGDA